MADTAAADARHVLLFPAIRPRLFFFDQAVWDTALKLKTEVGNSDPGSSQYAEALSLVLMHELIRLERSASGTVRPLNGGLPAWQRKRVVEFIEEHLSEEISLTTLAELLNLSLFHFARAFKGPSACLRIATIPHAGWSAPEPVADASALSNPNRRANWLSRNKFIYAGISQIHGSYTDRISASQEGLTQTGDDRGGL